jgi:hypothetical protein
MIDFLWLYNIIQCFLFFLWIKDWPLTITQSAINLDNINNIITASVMNCLLLQHTINWQKIAAEIYNVLDTYML